VARRRLEGEREVQILHIAFDLFVQHGFHGLSMAAVAARASASKATLYRRWPSKGALLKDAVLRCEEVIEPLAVDTGHLRNDLIEEFVGPAAALRRRLMRVLAGSPTTIDPDASIAAELNWRLSRSEGESNRQIFARAKARGEIDPDRNHDLLASVLPGVLMHHEAASGLTADRQLIEQIIDSMVLPASRAHPMLD
jgi:AcrR family transcriptional regulator